MNTFEKLDYYLQYLSTYATEIVMAVMAALVSDPELSKLVGATIIGLPLIGLALKTLDRENGFFLYAMSRLTGTLILYGMFFAIIVSSVVFCYVYVDDLKLNYQYFSKFYLNAFTSIYIPAINGASIGIGCGILFYIASRTLYTKCLTYIEGKLTWSTVTARGVPTEKDIKRLKVRKVTQRQLKRWLQKAHASQKVFIGVNNTTAKPIFIPLKNALAHCWQVSGQPGAGKGVFNQLLFSQFIKFKHVNIVFNPKKDEFARSALYSACKNAGLPFHRVDLTADHPSISVLNGCSGEEAFEVVCSGFGFEDTHEESSFYAAVARRIIREVTDQSVPKSIPEFLVNAQPTFAEVGKESANLANKLTELAFLRANQTEDASPLLDVFQHSGCLLIEGTPNNQSVLTLMKMLHVRIVQLASNRQPSETPVNIWLDEAKYVLCPSVINGLGTSRSFNFRYSITTQSNSDYETIQVPYSPEAARKVVNDDTPLRVIYSSRDHDTAESISKHCGTQEGIISSSSTSINELATETSNGERRVSISEEPIFHPNIIKGLPTGMAIITGAVPWPTLVSIPTLLVDKLNIQAHKAPPLDPKYQSGGENEELL